MSKRPNSFSHVKSKPYDEDDIFEIDEEKEEEEEETKRKNENDSDFEDDDEYDDEDAKPNPRIKIKGSVNIEEDEIEDISDDDEDDEEDDGAEDEDDRSEDEHPKNRSILPKFPEFEDDIEDEGGDKDEDEDDHYLQKFDESTKHNIISDFHPEMKVHNYDEIDILSTIVRDANGLIVDPLHRTLPFITKYEKARVLGERAKQLNSGAKALVEVDPTIIDGYLIALKEYEAKRIPFILKRPLPNGGCEYWRFKDLEH